MSDPETTAPGPESAFEEYTIRVHLPEASPAARMRLDKRIGTLVSKAGGVVISSDLTPSSIEAADAELPAFQSEETPYDAPFTPERDLFAPFVQARLDVSLVEALDTIDIDPASASILRGNLRRVALFSVRDAILGGTDYLYQRGIGAKSRKYVLDAVARICPEIPMRRGWTPDYAALFCSTLDTVPLYALRYGPHDTEPDATIIQGRWRSITAYLAEDESSLSERERNLGTREAVLAFAQRFEAARQIRLQARDSD